MWATHASPFYWIRIMHEQASYPSRKNIRLPDYDYTSPGVYSVTISTKEGQCLFGDTIDGTINLNPFGKIVHSCWLQMPDFFKHVTLDQFIVMPNHIHGLININDNPVGDACVAPTQKKSGPAKRSLGAILGSFKSAATKKINILRNSTGERVWHRGYYEHVIRQGDDLQAIREYIANNPLRWEINRENLYSPE